MFTMHDNIQRRCRGEMDQRLWFALMNLMQINQPCFLTLCAAKHFSSFSRAFCAYSNASKVSSFFCSADVLGRRERSRDARASLHRNSASSLDTHTHTTYIVLHRMCKCILKLSRCENNSFFPTASSCLWIISTFGCIQIYTWLRNMVQLRHPTPVGGANGHGWQEKHSKPIYLFVLSDNSVRGFNSWKSLVLWQSEVGYFTALVQNYTFVLTESALNTVVLDELRVYRNCISIEEKQLQKI